MNGPVRPLMGDCINNIIKRFHYHFMYLFQNKITQQRNNEE